MKNVIFLLVCGMLSVASLGRGAPLPFKEQSTILVEQHQHNVHDVSMVSFLPGVVQLPAATKTITLLPSNPVPDGCRSEVDQESTFRMALYRQTEYLFSIYNCQAMFTPENSILNRHRISHSRVLVC